MLAWCIGKPGLGNFDRPGFWVSGGIGSQDSTHARSFGSWWVGSPLRQYNTTLEYWVYGCRDHRLNRGRGKGMCGKEDHLGSVFHVRSDFTGVSKKMATILAGKRGG